MIVYPGKQWQTPTFKFTLIPQAPEALALPPPFSQAGLVAVLLITISDLLHSSRHSDQATISPWDPVTFFIRLVRKTWFDKEAGNNHEASCRWPAFPDLAGHFHRPRLFHFLTRQQAPSFSPFQTAHNPRFSACFLVCRSGIFSCSTGRIGTDASGPGQCNSLPTASWRSSELGQRS